MLSVLIIRGGTATKSFVYIDKPGEIFANWNKVELIAIPFWHRPSHQLYSWRLRRKLEHSRLFCIQTSLVFAYQPGYVSRRHSRKDVVSALRRWTLLYVQLPHFLVWLVMVSVRRFLVIIIYCASNKVNCVTSFASAWHIEQYIVLELVHESGYDTIIVFVDYSSSWEKWLRFLWAVEAPLCFRHGAGSLGQGKDISVSEISKRRHSAGVSQSSRVTYDIPRGEPVSLTEVTWSVRQIFARQYTADHEESLLAIQKNRRVLICLPVFYMVKMIATWPIWREVPTMVVRQQLLRLWAFYWGLLCGQWVRSFISFGHIIIGDT